ncbi:restriction endonuclease subunit S [Nonlabens sp. Asnod2-A12]|uniref:restriction endonuclease subunit S n=1 Tax=Nonlabens sp. Asnod2-A12 TaxID=3160578 RepID=UPI003869AB5F
MKKHRENVEMRFSTSTKPLKEEQLLQLADFSKGKDYSKKDIKLEGHPIILYGRLYTKYQVNIADVDTLTEPKDGSIYSQGGEVIIPSSGESAEDIIRASVIENDNIIIGGDLNIIKPKELIDSTFLALSISNGKMYEELVRKAQGKSVVHIRNSDLEETYLIYPPLEEQILIGDFFKNLDSLLANHNTQLKKLTNLKKAMLIKMFPQDGASVPEIRFNGFDGEWEKCILSDVTEYHNGKGYESEQSMSGKYELINLNSISIDGGLKPSGKFINNAELTLNKDDLVMILSDVGHGDLLGRVAIIPENNKYVLNQRVALLRPELEVLPLFLYYTINVNQIYFKMQGAGMSQLNISKSSVEDFEFLYPTNREEQIKVSNYFKNFDNLINNHKEQLKKLNQIKKACLSKLFVSQE